MQHHGVFVDCRTHWKGRIGNIAASFAKYKGGVLEIGPDGKDTGVGLSRSILHIAARMRLVCHSEDGTPDHGQSVLIRQENDPAPKFHFLEEGPVRIGMRIFFDLLDEHGHYHGDGRQDIWIYPEGDLHITTALKTADLAGHGPVQDAYLEIQGEPDCQEIALGTKTITGPEAQTIPFGEQLPGKSILLKGKHTSTALYWARDKGHALDWTTDHGRVPPFYASHWPTGMQQWGWHNMGWACDSGNVTASVTEQGPNIRLNWLEGAAINGDTTHAATLVVSHSDNVPDLERRISAVQNPLKPTVSAGRFRCYSDEDGVYEIEQGDPTQVHITFPPDPLERTARLRFYRRKTDPRHRGAVTATVNGQPILPQLISEGELTDDICVVMEMSHRNDSVDHVVLSTPLNRNTPTEICIKKTPGIQAVYQSESTGVDLQRRAGNRRDLVIWSSHNKQRPAFELDLFSCAVHRVTDHNQTEPAVWEIPMAWFKSCGNSKHQYCNFIKDFVIEKNGPDEIALYLRGTNPNQRAQSELWLSMPYNHPRPRMNVRMRMEILQQWDDPNIEFSDIFPYPSRLVETWFHDMVLFVQRDKTSTIYTYRPDTSVSSPGESNDDRLFYGLFATDRGNVLTLIKNPQHPEQKLHYSVCGNYIDVHVNLNPGEAPVPAGKTFEIEYIFELYGDANTTADEIKQIGLKSLESGDIVTP